jgi:hypothetical protein
MALRGRGFDTVQLSKLSIAQQIGLFRGAELIVAPHGMGLTHIAMAQRLNGLVEIFSPSSGTDAYAFMAKAGKVPYDCVIGENIASAAADFNVNVAQLIRSVDSVSQVGGRLFWKKPANLLRGSRYFTGFSASDTCKYADDTIPEMTWGNMVQGHRSATEMHDEGSIIGRWKGISVIPGLRYVASCWVWIPGDFEGSGIALGMEGASVIHAVAADIARTQMWQRISVTATPPSDHCEVELRLFSRPGISFCSTCWQFERGSGPTTYVETR